MKIQHSDKEREKHLHRNTNDFGAIMLTASVFTVVAAVAAIWKRQCFV